MVWLTRHLTSQHKPCILTIIFPLSVISIAATTLKFNNNIFAAVDHMDPLVDVEYRLVEIARADLEHRRKTLNRLTHFVQLLEESLRLFQHNPSFYNSNPINNYHVINRIQTQWRNLPPYLNFQFERNSADIELILKSNVHSLPTEDVDVIGLTKAVLRLMDVYDISTSDVSDGNIGLTPSKLQLTASDCLKIAQNSRKLDRYKHMKLWLHEAERLINDETKEHRHGETSPAVVHQHLSFSYYLEGDFHTAIKYATLVLKDEPHNHQAAEDKANYLWHIENNWPCMHNESGRMRGDIAYVSELTTYISGCRRINMTLHSYRNIWNLRSYYKHDAPILYLKPMKITQVHDNPGVYLIHDLLDSKMIKRLKDMATPMLLMSGVVDLEKDYLVTADYRVSKNAWLEEEEFPEMVEINRKLDPLFEAVSGLSLETAEVLQMNNYGAGGQFEFHFDHGDPGSLIEQQPEGNRIATLLLYLSEVEAGGETVFTEIGLSLPPVKGMGVFWHNLHRNGTGNLLTRHASCPVIVGSKWVANKWIRERGNEFTRPCSLQQQE